MSKTFKRILKRITVISYCIIAVGILAFGIGYPFALAGDACPWWIILIILPLLIIVTGTMPEVMDWADKNKENN